MQRMLGIDVGLPPLPEREERLDFLEHYAAASGRRLERLAGSLPNGSPGRPGSSTCPARAPGC